MAFEQNPLKALVKSKKFQVLIGWTIYLSFIAYQASSEQAVTLLGWASVVASAFLIGQSIVDAVAVYCGKNGDDPQ